MPEEFKRPAILDEMDETFNTAPIEEAGGIMQGILNEQSETSVVERPETTVVESKKELPNDYLPLNSSIQELTKIVTDKFSHYDKRFNDLSSNFDTVRQPAPAAQPQQPSYQYDPEAPVTMAHLQQMVQAYTGVNNTSQEAYKNSAKTRGLVEFMRFKQENPDFVMDPMDIDRTVDKAFQVGQPQMVTNANWRGHFENLYSEVRTTKLADSAKRITELEKELETLKKRPVPTTTTPVSPAVGKTNSRAIETPTSEPNEDITKIKSFSQKGNFKGFGNELKRKYGIAK